MQRVVAAEEQLQSTTQTVFPLGPVDAELRPALGVPLGHPAWPRQLPDQSASGCSGITSLHAAAQ
jgi:hypothetical protein